MSKLIPVIYKNMNYPPHIEANIHEVTGNFYKEKLIVKTPYSLHTEPSSVPKTFNSKIVNEFPYIKKAQRGNIAQLWHEEKWADEFFLYIDWLIGSNIPPDVLEIHPPFKDYCVSFEQFLGIFEVFHEKFKSKYPTTTIVIENRFGTRYISDTKEDKHPFLLSTCSDVLEFSQILSSRRISNGLKIVLDYPQLFSAEVGKNKKEENWMGANPLQLLEKIISFNLEIKKHREVIGGFHIWGKLKTGNRWTPHAGNLDTFFSNDNELKQKFLSSVFSTFNDGMIRYFVPEVNSGESDFHSIVDDMENAGMENVGFIFISKKKYVDMKAFNDFNFRGFKIPEKNLEYRESGFIENSLVGIQFCFGEKDGKEYMDLCCLHRMDNVRIHERIYEDGKHEQLLSPLYLYVNNPCDLKEKIKIYDEYYKIINKNSELVTENMYLRYFADFNDQTDRLIANRWDYENGLYLHQHARSGDFYIFEVKGKYLINTHTVESFIHRSVNGYYKEWNWWMTIENILKRISNNGGFRYMVTQYDLDKAKSRGNLLIDGDYIYTENLEDKAIRKYFEELK